MFIKKKEYQRIKDDLENYKALKIEVENRDSVISGLEKEIDRLSNLITEKTQDCAVGVWCEDCIHYGCEKAVVPQRRIGSLYDATSIWAADRTEHGETQFCKKYLHKICPEHEFKNKN